MNLKKLLLSAFVLSLLSTLSVNAQVNLLNAKTIDQIGKESMEKIAVDNDKPLPYGYIDDRDILWSKIVWEYVDLNQKINFPYYFPIDTLNISKNKRSLFDTLLKAIRNGEIEEVSSDSFFKVVTTKEEIEQKLINLRQNGRYVDTFRIQTRDIQAYMLKGMWYFDKRHSEMKYRILAIAPMGRDVLTLGLEDIQDDQLYELFWIFYPSAREVLHKAKVFNPKNVSQPISFDHLLNARRFTSVIVQEENIYDNRKIAEYIKGNALYQLLEARKIKEEIRNREMDMWNY